MVGIIENQSLIEGTVQTITHNPDEKGYYLVRVNLLHSRNVASLPNLALADEGTDIQVKVLPTQLKNLSLQPKAHISCKVKKAFGQVYYLMDCT